MESVFGFGYFFWGGGAGLPLGRDYIWKQNKEN